jgi:hypothetical protein
MSGLITVRLATSAMPYHHRIIIIIIMRVILIVSLLVYPVSFYIEY